MSTIEITSKIEDLRELEALIEEAKAEAESLRDEINDGWHPVDASLFFNVPVSLCRGRVRHIGPSRIPSMSVRIRRDRPPGRSLPDDRNVR